MDSFLPSLDAHAHLSPSWKDALDHSGAVLSMTLSLEGAAQAAERQDGWVAWGVGCHPRFLRAQEAFDADRFHELLAKTAVAGEIGLDTGSRVPLEQQLRTFRQELDVLTRLPRITSIHSYRSTHLVLAELRRRPIAIPVLHWWTGSADETSEAVALGCYFSVHSAVARQSKFRTRVPPQRLLVESDHGTNDPPAAIPCRVEWVEYLVAQQLKLEREAFRRLAWCNLAEIVQLAGVHDLLPVQIKTILSQHH